MEHRLEQLFESQNKTRGLVLERNNLKNLVCISSAPKHNNNNDKNNGDDENKNDDNGNNNHNNNDNNGLIIFNCTLCSF